MLKALLKKQLMELYSFYFQDRKTGKRRSKGKAAGFIALYLVLFVGLGFSFYAVASMVIKAFAPLGLSWLYFAIMGLLALFLGVFGGVFNTYTSLYQAKDNELLLSMPIPVGKLLFVRMAGVYTLDLMYTAIVYIPVVIAYFIYGAPGVGGVVCSILLLFVLGFVGLVLCCLLGWVVALISGKLKNKSFVTVIVALAAFAVYYYCCMNYYSAIENLIANAAQVSVSVKTKGYPLYLFGQAATGNFVSLVILLAATAVLVALTAWALSRTFLRIATSSQVTSRAVYHEKPVKVTGADGALLRKEWKRFSASPAYMLNCGLGTVLMVVAAVAVLIFRERLTPVLELMAAQHDFLPVLAAVLVCLLVSMNDMSAPSVSLEGKNIWILQTLPVDPARALNAKKRLHQLLTLPPAALLSVCLGIALKLEMEEIVLLAGLGMAFGMLSAAGGVAINLKKPNLTWTNESVPVKQSMGVMICLFGGWLISILVGVGGYFATRVLEGWQYLTICLVVLALASRMLDRWLTTKGAEIFADL